MEDTAATIAWLLEGDVSIQYQVYRDLLGVEREDLRKRIEQEGWGRAFLAQRHAEGHWRKSYYQPKWTSSHYTLLDLRNLCIAPNNALIRASIDQIAATRKVSDGGINPAKTTQDSDVCVNGMFLNYAAYFETAEDKLASIVDFILSQRMKDGGFNCRLNRSGARHSSLHSTLSILEGIASYISNGYTYKIEELKIAEEAALAFILHHQLYLSDRTGAIIHKDFVKFHYPYRWRYDILRALDYFQSAQVEWDDRMQAAITHLLNKKTKDLRWKLAAKYPGQVHFEMEKAGKPSRWNTLRALRVISHFGDSIRTTEGHQLFKFHDSIHRHEKI